MRYYFFTSLPDYKTKGPACRDGQAYTENHAGYVCSVIGIVLNTVFPLGMIILAVTAGVALSEAANSLPDILNSIGI